jgi:molybdopterin synthase sulfur carrier subunit
MLDTTPMVTISLYYWAGAKAAAGLAMERFEANSVADALRQARDARSDARFDRVLSVSSVMVDGLVVQGVDLEQPLTEDVRVEILPPFAGGALTSDQNHDDRPSC